MSIKSFFKLKSKRSTAIYESSRIECRSEELKEIIANWTERTGWEYDNFADFMELIGLKTPVKLIRKAKSEFKCITADGKEIGITLFPEDYSTCSSEIWLTDEGGIKKYKVKHQIRKVNTQITPEVEHFIEKNGKSLIRYYSDRFCYRTIWLSEAYLLKVEVDEPNRFEKPSEVSVLRNCEQIEEYLLGLSKAVEVKEVFRKVMNFLEFSYDDIYNCERIFISYVKKDGKTERTLSQIYFKYGVSQK